MTRILEFPIKLTYDKEYKGWVAECITLYGCMSQGKTREEALKNIDKAIKAFLETIEKTPQDQFATREIEVSIP